MAVVTYRKWLFTGGSNCKSLTGKILVFWIGGHLWEVVAYERWSHMKVRLYPFMQIVISKYCISIKINLTNIVNYLLITLLNQSFKKMNCHLFPALPAAPLNANATVVKATYVVIKWERSPDDSDGKLKYAVDCFSCKSSKYKVCNKPCGPSAQYRPSQDKITNVTVTINGLPSDSFLKFRVYSVGELNEEEKDRDKWNYVTVSVKTRGKKQ